MKLSNYKTIILFIALTMTSLGACKKFLEIPPPKTQLTNQTVFADDNSANSAMAGIYSNLYNNTQSIFNGQYISIFCGLMGDELQVTGNLLNLYGPFQFNSLSPSNTDITVCWQNLYNSIYACNMLLENIPASTALTTPVKSELRAEALFIRALCYFYLTRLFGDVPLVLVTDPKATSTLPRLAVSTIDQQLITDLTEAQGSLPADYSYSGGNPIRVNKYVATAFLARIYLYDQDWAAAEAAASAIINDSSVYQLEPALNKVFLQNSSEAIWQILSYNGVGYTYLGQHFIPSASGIIPNYIITPALLSAFETGDQRRQFWIDSTQVDSQNYFYPSKYKQVAPASGALAENEMVFRLAEQYLIRAESRAEQNNLAAAISDLNRIRNRAGLANSIAGDQPSILSAIGRERQTEFFTEWGHRWFDLIRTASINGVLGPEKPGWKSGAALLPIPQIELGRNPNLSQNPGY